MEMMQKLSKSDWCEATSDFGRLGEADAVLLCVPTPLDDHREPDMQYVEKTCLTVGEHLREGQLVILESTTYPGTTEDLIIPILESKSGLKAGKDFYVAYSPEREDPDNPNFNTAKIPKVVGGHGEEALKLACTLYDMAIIQTVPVSDTKTAEAVKITENVFRAVNIALVNELKVVYERMGIDVHEVLDAADTKPFGFMKFVPGPGLGGHCIPIAPFYLTWKAREYEENTRFIELAGEINTSMPWYVIDRALKGLNAHKKAMNGSNILVIGLAYEPDVDDLLLKENFTEDSGSSSDRITITYAGNIGDGQGLDKIVPDAALKLKDEFTFQIIGDGGTREQLNREIEKRNLTNVKVIDPVDRQELLNYYKNSDYLFLHLNNFEAFKKVLPSKIFEYAATNKTLIAGVNGYSRIFLEEEVDEVILFSPCDSNEMVNKLRAYRLKEINRQQFINKYKRSSIMNEMAGSIIEAAI